MRYDAQTLQLRGGKTCVLRSPETDAAPTLLAFLKQAAEETPFLARYADEITLTEDEERSFVTGCLQNPGQLMICAFCEGRVVASASFFRKAPMERFAHRASVAIAVLAPWWGCGLGSALMARLLAAAQTSGYETAELEVAAANRRAISLYLKHGFAFCGAFPHGFRYRDGTYDAEYLMARALSAESPEALGKEPAQEIGANR